MERQGRDMDRFHEMNQVKVENKISPYRYVISTERYSRFGQLVKASSLSRTIHSTGVTLLCPTDDAFENWTPWLRLIKEGKQYEIDDFVGNHVIPMTLTYAFDVHDDGLRAVLGNPDYDIAYPQATLYLNGDDEDAVRALQADIEAGAKPQLVGAPSVQGGKTIHRIRTIESV